MTHLTEEVQKIREKAYYLWNEAKRPQGRDLEFWIIAEQIIEHEFLTNLFHQHEEKKDNLIPVQIPISRKKQKSSLEAIGINTYSMDKQ